MRNAFRRWGVSALAVCSVWALSGCGTTTPYKAFDDLSLKEDQYAVIDCVTKNKYTQEMDGQREKTLADFLEEARYYKAHILRLDGKLISMVGKTAVHVLPGKHTLQIACYKYLDTGASRERLSAFVDRWLVAEAGQTYYVIAKAAEENSYRVQVVIVDEQGKPAGGVVGSDDEPNADIESEEQR